MAQKLMVCSTLPIKRRKTVKNLSSKSSRKGQSPEIWAKKPKKPSIKAQFSEMTPQLQHSSTRICWNVAIFFFWRRWGPERRGRRGIPDCGWLTDASSGMGHPPAPRADSPLLHTGLQDLRSSSQSLTSPSCQPDTEICPSSVDCRKTTQEGMEMPEI